MLNSTYMVWLRQNSARVAFGAFLALTLGILSRCAGNDDGNKVAGTGKPEPDDDAEIVQPMPMGLLASQAFFDEVARLSAPAAGDAVADDNKALAASIFDSGQQPGDIDTRLAESRARIAPNATREMLRVMRNVARLIQDIAGPDGPFKAKDVPIPVQGGTGARTFDLGAPQIAGGAHYARLAIDRARADAPYSVEVYRDDATTGRASLALTIRFLPIDGGIRARIERMDATSATVFDWNVLTYDSVAATLEAWFGVVPRTPSTPGATLVTLAINRGDGRIAVDGALAWTIEPPAVVAAGPVPLPRFLDTRTGDVDLFASVTADSAKAESVQRLAYLPAGGFDPGNVMTSLATFKANDYFVSAQAFLTSLLRTRAVNPGCADLGARLRTALIAAGQDPGMAYPDSVASFCADNTLASDGSIFAAAALACTKSVAIRLELSFADGTSREFYWCNKFVGLALLANDQYGETAIDDVGQVVRRFLAPASLDALLAHVPPTAAHTALAAALDARPPADLSRVLGEAPIGPSMIDVAALGKVEVSP